MKYVVVLFGVICAFLMADFIWSQKSVDSSVVGGALGTAPGLAGAAPGKAPAFDHALHGDSIGMDCAACHTGARSGARAFMPSKGDCMDCHRLPLTENPGIETLDSALTVSPENPWSKKSVLPEHVVFHHGVHHAAKVNCADCHGQGYSKDSYGGESFSMQTCVNCHRGVTFTEKKFRRASVECAACHR